MGTVIFSVIWVVRNALGQIFSRVLSYPAHLNAMSCIRHITAVDLALI